jgi:hypothetical protein
MEQGFLSREERAGGEEKSGRQVFKNELGSALRRMNKLFHAGQIFQPL